MALHLTPDILAASYDLLRTTLPFRRWKLPPSDEIEFIVNADRHVRGFYSDRPEGFGQPVHKLGASCAVLSTLDSLLPVVGHEIIHLFQNIAGRETRAMHNADFRRLSVQVCRHHGWDLAAFA